MQSFPLQEDKNCGSVDGSSPLRPSYSKIQVISYSEDEMYKTFCKWWKKYRVQSVRDEFLRPPAVGIVLSDGDKLLGALWLYEHKPVSMILDHILITPEIRGKERTSLIEYLIKIAKYKANELGFGSVYFFATSKNLVNTFKKLDFNSEDVTLMWSNL